MKKFEIVFESADDIVEFVKCACRSECEIDLKYNHIVIDAKSLVGVMAVGVNKTVEVICHGDSGCLDEILCKLSQAVA